MANPIIEVKGLSKRYRLGTFGARTLREEAEVLWNRIRRRATPTVSATDFWALRDVSFEIEPGDVVGIIGRNGAGKSTLLKILSRITEPTQGEVILRGRAASLLEVGTGFHPELSGRENIFLNGAILGMTRAEIRRKFDEIVDFAEVEKFIDVPVKRYSSGMYVRLAFAVAAHLEPEILIVDEVLAVGDAAFQKKCLGKMNSVSSTEGRTVLFVSHNMNAVESICKKCVVMRAGQVADQGPQVGRMLREYLMETESGERSTSWVNSSGQWENPYFTPHSFSLCDADGQPVASPARNDQDLFIRLEGEVLKEDAGLQLGYGLFHASGPLLFWSTNTDVPEGEWQRLKPGRHVLFSRLPAHSLNEGDYRFDLFLGLHHRLWICEPGVNAPSVTLSVEGGLSRSPHWVEGRPGLIGPILKWSVENEPALCLR